MEQGKDDTLIDIIIDDELVSSIIESLEIVAGLPSECCIYRVHDNLRALNEKAYVPHLVSVGPYHHGKGNLKSMEKYKWNYLKSFLGPKPLMLVENYVQVFRDFEQDARRCYAETFSSLSSNEFVKMLVLDGCFIIELFLRYRLNDRRQKDDPIFNTSWMLTSINRDLMLLENQLPFFVLVNLLTFNPVDTHANPSNYLSESARSFFSGMMPIPLQMNAIVRSHKHLLDVIRNALLPPVEERSSQNIQKLKLVPCAMKLQQFGIKFKKGEDFNLLGIKFSNGVLEIPPLKIQDVTEPLLRNLIAYEQCHIGCTNEFTSYAFLMDSLISNKMDVEILENHGILDSWLGSDEDVMGFLNKFCVEVNLDYDFYFSELCEHVNKYCKKRWHRYCADLRRDYFYNPWAWISVACGRNKFKFEGQEIRVQDIYKNVCTHTEQVSKAYKKETDTPRKTATSDMMVEFTRTEQMKHENWHRIYGGGAYEKDTGRGAVAAICKGQDGRLIGAVYIKFKCQNAMQAECRGVELAIILAHKLQIKNMVILGDSQRLVKTLAAGENTLVWDFEEDYNRLKNTMREYNENYP
ncbi:hypothetical protein IFM89_033873 [Coptis chinensis]|uniref:RNase H type-1 domain-containing protein n=1 Tax=Coptis chinensis TaxID=261450 RepID=A0A835LFA7_9MAGN|nr:hypothetical protein IFM89_033873 [Coptis chinensis]